jgi:hypothetical protein
MGGLRQIRPERERTSPETNSAAKSARDRIPVKDGPVEGGRSPREKPTAERVGHNRRAGGRERERERERERHRDR